MLEDVGWVLRDVVQPTPCVPGLQVKQVAAGGMHSCVLTDTGEVGIVSAHITPVASGACAEFTHP